MILYHDCQLPLPIVKLLFNYYKKLTIEIRKLNPNLRTQSELTFQKSEEIMIRVGNESGVIIPIKKHLVSVMVDISSIPQLDQILGSLLKAIRQRSGNIELFDVIIQSRIFQLNINDERLTDITLNRMFSSKSVKTMAKNHQKE